MTASKINPNQFIYSKESDPRYDRLCKTLDSDESRDSLKLFLVELETGAFDNCSNNLREQIEYVAWGIRQHLENRKPWPVKTGREPCVSPADVFLMVQFNPEAKREDVIRFLEGRGLCKRRAAERVYDTMFKPLRDGVPFDEVFN